jgi:putative ABC transport system ATP-binding protein
VLELPSSLNRDGTTLIMVTHDLSIARTLRRAIRMKDGRIEADGEAAQVISGLHQSELELAC